MGAEKESSQTRHAPMVQLTLAHRWESEDARTGKRPFAGAHRIAHTNAASTRASDIAQSPTDSLPFFSHEGVLKRQGILGEQICGILTCGWRKNLAEAPQPRRTWADECIRPPCTPCSSSSACRRARMPAALPPQTLPTRPPLCSHPRQRCSCRCHRPFWEPFPSAWLRPSPRCTWHASGAHLALTHAPCHTPHHASRIPESPRPLYHLPPQETLLSPRVDAR